MICVKVHRNCLTIGLQGENLSDSGVVQRFIASYDGMHNFIHETLHIVQICWLDYEKAVLLDKYKRYVLKCEYAVKINIHIMKSGDDIYEYIIFISIDFKSGKLA